MPASPKETVPQVPSFQPVSANRYNEVKRCVVKDIPGAQHPSGAIRASKP